MNQTSPGWRKRQIALNKKAENARELGLDYDVHSCSPFCTQPLCVAVREAVQAEREACANKTGEFAQKWWSIHCDSNKHMETTRKAHDDFCALQAAIRARGQA